MTHPVESGWCVTQPRPRDTPAWREAVRAGLISPVPAEPPDLVVRPSAHSLQRVLFATVAMSVLVLAFLLLTGGRNGAFTAGGLGRFLTAAVVCATACGYTIRRWGRAVLDEATAGYTTTPFDLGRFWIGAAPEAPWTFGWIGWDFSGLWVMAPDGTVEAAPRSDRDPPGVYPSPNRPGEWELWTGSQWSAHFPRHRTGSRS